MLVGKASLGNNNPSFTCARNDKNNLNYFTAVSPIKASWLKDCKGCEVFVFLKRMKALGRWLSLWV